MVRLFWEIRIVWGQMRDNIMTICYSNRVGHKLTVIRCKHCVANTRLSKCHNLYSLCFMIDLQIVSLVNKNCSFANIGRFFYFLSVTEEIVERTINRMTKNKLTNQTSSNHLGLLLALLKRLLFSRNMEKSQVQTRVYKCSIMFYEEWYKD